MQGGGGFGPPPGAPPPGGGFGAPPPGAPPPGGGFGPPPGPPPGGGFGPQPGGEMGPPPGMGGGGGSQDQMAMISVGLGGAASLLGCVSIFCCIGYLSVPLGIGGLVTGFMFLQKVKENPALEPKKNLAIAGMALGALGLVLPVIAIILGIFLGIGNGMMQQLNH